MEEYYYDAKCIFDVVIVADGLGEWIVEDVETARA
jgi:hypothetical protein